MAPAPLLNYLVRQHAMQAAIPLRASAELRLTRPLDPVRPRRLDINRRWQVTLYVDMSLIGCEADAPFPSGRRLSGAVPADGTVSKSTGPGFGAQLYHQVGSFTMSRPQSKTMVYSTRAGHPIRCGSRNVRRYACGVVRSARVKCLRRLSGLPKPHF
jgi:hypothetical protein